LGRALFLWCAYPAPMPRCTCHVWVRSALAFYVCMSVALFGTSPCADVNASRQAHVFTFTHTRTHTHLHAHTQTRTLYTHTHAHAHAPTGTHTHTHRRTDAHTHPVHSQAYADSPEVTTPLLKFMAEFVFNKSTRLTFEPSSPNGILLFRSARTFCAPLGSINRSPIGINQSINQWYPAHRAFARAGRATCSGRAGGAEGKGHAKDMLRTC